MSAPARPVAERFWEKVARTDGCWHWTCGLTHDGYAKFWLDGSTIGAHRWAYEERFGAIQENMQIDHLCRNRACVNPDHMEVVTVQENLRRRDAIRTHCPQGHPLSGDNLRTRREGWRSCRECVNGAKREKRAAQRAAGFSSRGRALRA